MFLHEIQCDKASLNLRNFHWQALTRVSCRCFQQRPANRHAARGLKAQCFLPRRFTQGRVYRDGRGPSSWLPRRQVAGRKRCRSLPVSPLAQGQAHGTQDTWPLRIWATGCGDVAPCHMWWLCTVVAAAPWGTLLENGSLHPGHDLAISS